MRGRSAAPSAANYSNKFASYDVSKPKTPIRIRLCVGRMITVEVTEDWDYEDLYSFAADAEPGFAFDLLGGYPPKKMAADATKVLASGLGGTVIRQVRKYSVCCHKGACMIPIRVSRVSPNKHPNPSYSSLASSAAGFSAG